MASIVIDVKLRILQRLREARERIATGADRDTEFRLACRDIGEYCDDLDVEVRFMMENVW